MEHSQSVESKMQKVIIGLVFIFSCLSGCQPDPGSAGPPGPIGPQGPQGLSTLFLDVPNDPNCQYGGTVILQGLDSNDDGVLESNEVTQSTDVCNGAPGTPAPVSQAFPVVAIAPCGTDSSSYKEILLGLYGGGVFSEFSGSSSALNTRNVLLPNGSYYDTDSSECNFTVSTDSQGNVTIAWDGSSANQVGYPYSAGSAVYTANNESWVINY
jgi:hypothetical protein